MTIMSEHAAIQYQYKVQAALEAAKKVLDTSRNPTYPSGCPHSYNDKYLLAEIATRTVTASVGDALDVCLPQWNRKLAEMKSWVNEHEQTVTLRNEGTIRCDFVRTAERTVDMATYVTKSTREKSSLFGESKKKETATVSTTIVEHIWKICTTWEVSAYSGADCSSNGIKVVLANGTGEVEQITRGDRINKPSTPRKEVVALDIVQTDITWLLSNLTAEGGVGEPQFTIDREANSCKTPRRNEDITAALKAFSDMDHFVQAATWKNFSGKIFQVLGEGVNMEPFYHVAEDIFSPVLTMFSLEEPTEPITDATVGPTLSSRDLTSFLAEHKRSMEESASKLAVLCPSGADGTIITPLATGIMTKFLHIGNLCLHYKEAIGAVEAMIRSQLIAAIGKAVQPKDFSEYMDFHNRNLFKVEHAPERFCYAIRQEGRYPDGTLSIEQSVGNTMPLLTSVVKRNAVRPMKITLSASSELSFMGDRYVHAAILHSFSGQNAGKLNLVASAKQFSSFILLAGRITAADQFEPTAAVIVKDKDNLSIPLMLEMIPTPKEFQDAIESLSPEQQRFAKAYRSLQLSSTLFGVCIIQIKPQLEKVLNLPDGALTKEIQLTQDLMDLFIKYQVSSDLLSYDGLAEETQTAKLDAVKAHVGQIKKVIQAQGDNELKEADEMKKKALLEKQEQPEMYDYFSSATAEACSAESRPRLLSSAESRPRLLSGGRGGRGGNGSIQSVPMTKNIKINNYSIASVEECSMPMTKSIKMNKQSMALPTKAPSFTASGTVAPVMQPQQQQKHDISVIMDNQEIDYTKLPTMLKIKFEELDTDSTLHPTIINIGPTWTRKSQAGLLSKPVTQTLHTSQQKDEKGKAFDLLDALTRSGVLTVAEASIHVVLAATHCFDKTVTNAVVMDNVNPIEKVERSALIIASAITGKTATELIKPDQLGRIGLYSPMLGTTHGVSP